MAGSRAVWVAVAALYLGTFPYHPALRSPNELCRLWQTRSLVEYGTLDVNQALRDYGRVGDLSVKDGRYYPSKAPLLSFAAVPIYAALRALGGGFRYAVPELPLVFFSRLLLTVLPTLLMLVLVRRFLRAHVSPAVSEIVAVAYALGSLAFSYSLLFMSHQTTAVLLFAGFYALWRLARGEWGPGGYVVAGACAGASVAAEYTSVLGAVGLLLYGVAAVALRPEPPSARVRRLAGGAALGLLGALPFILGLMAYHQAAFGHPLHSGYKYLADAAYQPWHEGGLLGIRLPEGRALLLSFFSPLRGLFILAPFLLLALPGTALLLRRRDGGGEQRALGVFTAALWLGYTYFTASFSYDSWGWTTGPRHLTGLVPFLLLPTALALERLRVRRSGGAAGVAAGALAASVLTTGAVTLINYIPDSASNALLGIALPLLGAGYFPATLLSFVGVPSPAAGLPMLVLLVAVAVWLFRRALSLGEGARPGAASWAAGLITLALFGGVQLLTARPAQDSAAVAFLQSVWLAPPGAAVTLWPPRSAP